MSIGLNISLTGPSAESGKSTMEGGRTSMADNSEGERPIDLPVYDRQR
ncbi:hypothetical protein [Paenibacillus silagei]|nr:hypothetical protein [Paenibacillus silagei]